MTKVSITRYPDQICSELRILLEDNIDKVILDNIHEALQEAGKQFVKDNMDKILAELKTENIEKYVAEYVTRNLELKLKENNNAR